jgi:hypothetical protein
LAVAPAALGARVHLRDGPGKTGPREEERQTEKRSGEVAVSTVTGCRARSRDISKDHKQDLVAVFARRRRRLGPSFDGDDHYGLYDASGCLIRGWRLLAELSPVLKNKHPSAH